MILVLKEADGWWTRVGFLVAVAISTFSVEPILSTKSDLVLLLACIALAAMDIKIFCEEVKMKYFLDYEKNKKVIPISFCFLLEIALLATVLYFIFEKGPDAPALGVSFLIRSMTVSFEGILIFLLPVGLLEKRHGNIDYTTSHRKTEEFCKKIRMFRDNSCDFNDRDLENLLDILNLLKENIKRNQDLELKGNKSLQNFMHNIIELERLFGSYWNFSASFEIPRIIKSTKYPIFLHETSNESHISYSDVFEIASRSTLEFKEQLSKRILESLLIKPLFVFISGCESYDELYFWKHPNHSEQIGKCNDIILTEFLKNAPRISRQPIVAFDIYGKPPSCFYDKKYFVRQLKVATAREKDTIACLYSEKCNLDDICQAGIDKLNEIRKSRSISNFEPEKIPNSENSLKEVLRDFYECYTHIEGIDPLKEYRKNKGDINA